MKKIKMLVAFVLVFSFVLSVMPFAFAEGPAAPVDEEVTATEEAVEDEEAVEAEETEEVEEAVAYEDLAYESVSVYGQTGIAIGSYIAISSEADGAVALNAKVAREISNFLYEYNGRRCLQMSVVFEVEDNGQVAKISGTITAEGDVRTYSFVYYYDKETEAEITLEKYEEIIAAAEAAAAEVEEATEEVEEAVEETEEATEEVVEGKTE